MPLQVGRMRKQQTTNNILGELCMIHNFQIHYSGITLKPWDFSYCPSKMVVLWNYFLYKHRYIRSHWWMLCGDIYGHTLVKWERWYQGMSKVCVLDITGYQKALWDLIDFCHKFQMSLSITFDPSWGNSIVLNLVQRIPSHYNHTWLVIYPRIFKPLPPPSALHSPPSVLLPPSHETPQKFPLPLLCLKKIQKIYKNKSPPQTSKTVVV